MALDTVGLKRVMRQHEAFWAALAADAWHPDEAFRLRSVMKAQSALELLLERMGHGPEAGDSMARRLSRASHHFRADVQVAEVKSATRQRNRLVHEAASTSTPDGRMCASLVRVYRDAFLALRDACVRAAWLDLEHRAQDPSLARRDAELDVADDEPEDDW